MKHSEYLTQFRPIALCNVLIKLVIEVLANRLKSLMPKLTGEQQASFFPGRQAIDNIVIAQEMIHLLERKTERKGDMVIKVDLEKAYDRIAWPFFQEVILAAGFNTHLTGLILSCISSITITVLWNGKQLKEFQPKRGLRQGDPLSPYLFVLCMEVLGQRISDVVTQGRWKPLKTSQNSPYISHLFFVDDLLLFGEASSEQAQCMKIILADFYNISGQCVNLAKLSICFSANTSRGVRHSISTAAQVPIAEELEVYLGVPCLHKRVNHSTYDNIVMKVRSKLAG